MLQTAGVLYILTYKCFSRHSSVPFLRIEISKIGPRLWCFVRFDLKICFSPQRHAIFEHRNSKKLFRPCSVLCILTYKCASRHSGVQFLDIGASKIGPRLLCFVHFALKMCFAPHWRAIFHLSARTGTSAPAALPSLLFEHQEARIIEKNTASRDVPNISRACIHLR